MEDPPPCEQCLQLERELELLLRQEAERNARILALQQANRDQEVRIAALERRLLALSRRRG
jgi:hypothetical protein